MNPIQMVDLKSQYKKIKRCFGLFSHNCKGIIEIKVPILCVTLRVALIDAT